MSVQTMTDRTAETFVDRLVADLGSTIGLLTVEAGARAGLWQRLVGAGPTTAAELAREIAGVRAAGPRVAAGPGGGRLPRLRRGR